MRSLRNRLRGWVVATSALTVGLVTAAGIVEERQQIERAEGAYLGSFLEHLSAMPEFRGRSGTVRAHLEMLTESFHRTGGTVQLAPFGTSAPSLGGRLVARQPLLLEDGAFELQYWSDGRYAMGRFQRAFAIHLAYALATILALVLGIEWILRQHLLSPLDTISRQIERMAEDGGGLASGPQPDVEFARLTRALRSLGPGLASQTRRWIEAERQHAAEEKASLEDQLRQSQKLEAIGRLAGGVAHDFNNLTAIVLGYTEMLLGQLGPGDPLRKGAEQIMEAGRRSAALTRQLLAFSRRQTLRPEVLDINALLRNFEQMLGRLIGEDVTMDFRLASDLGRVKADPGQIEQVVTNLVVNARDAMPRGGRLRVETANDEFEEMNVSDHESVVSGRYVMLSVTDTGCGMDKPTMARLFEPFFTTKEKGKGTGLGLATAYGIVKQSGGHIWASSDPGKGTTFKIYLPRTDAEPEAKVVDADWEAPRGRGERILLVEDEASLRELCETVLSRLGYRVVAAGNGPEALLLVQEKGLEFDLVVTDVVMPGMSGAEMADRLRRDRPGLRVLYMSGFPDEAIAPYGVLDSGTPFIQKPFTERAIAAKVRDVLGGKAAAARPGRCILMIDDDEQFRDLVRHFCMKRGHVFAGVDSSAAALEALAGHTFDVLLVDMNMPGTSGGRVLEEIRAAGHAAPAIVLTGDVVSANMDALRPLGAVQVLEKSSRPEPLLQAIEEVVTLNDAMRGM